MINKIEKPSSARFIKTGKLLIKNKIENQNK